MIRASQCHVKMEEFADVPQEDTRAAARMITLETTAKVSIIVSMYTLSTKNIDIVILC